MDAWRSGPGRDVHHERVDERTQGVGSTENLAPTDSDAAPDRSNPITVGAIAVVAYALCDMVHEVLGHGTATLASPAVKAVMLTTVALSTDGSSRLVAAAGTIANLTAAIAAFLVLGRRRGAPAWRYFLWLFGSINLFNATAYFLYSGILDSGDWGIVIAGLEPHLLWRAGMVAVGVTTYVLSVRISARALRGMILDGSAPAADVNRLATLPYWVGGTLLVLGSVPNPVSPLLILTSGAASGFGAMAGLLALPRMRGIGASAGIDASAVGAARPLALSRGWVAAALVTAAMFIFVIGRGIRL